MVYYSAWIDIGSVTLDNDGCKKGTPWICYECNSGWTMNSNTLRCSCDGGNCDETEEEDDDQGDSSASILGFSILLLFTFTLLVWIIW